MRDDSSSKKVRPTAQPLRPAASHLHQMRVEVRGKGRRRRGGQVEELQRGRAHNHCTEQQPTCFSTHVEVKGERRVGVGEVGLKQTAVAKKSSRNASIPTTVINLVHTNPPTLPHTAAHPSPALVACPAISPRAVYRLLWRYDAQAR